MSTLCSERTDGLLQQQRGCSRNRYKTLCSSCPGEHACKSNQCELFFPPLVLDISGTGSEKKMPKSDGPHSQYTMRRIRCKPRQETLAQLEQDADREIEELKEMHLDPAQMQVDPQQVTRCGRNIKEPKRIFMDIWDYQMSAAAFQAVSLVHG